MVGLFSKRRICYIDFTMFQLPVVLNITPDATSNCKPGRNKSSYFLKGTTRQVMTLPPTPGGLLAKQVRDQMGAYMGPDQGTTRFQESAGTAVEACEG